MSIGAAPATPIVGDASDEAPVEVDVDGHARAPGCHGEPLAAALRAMEERQAERRLDASVRVAGRPVGWRP